MVDTHNALNLTDIDEEKVSFTAKDRGDVTDAKWPVKTMAFFKLGAPVMIFYNVNKNIHNGTTATFVRKTILLFYWFEMSNAFKIELGFNYSQISGVGSR